jgi:tetratricopeptide (TPR) repeat protein
MKMRLPVFIAVMAISFFARVTFAADLQTDFAAANKLYDEGKFSDAANAYEKIIQAGKISPSLLFNYGNAEFKAGQIGRAIVAFCRAGELAPRDSDIRANLEFVRNQVQGPTLRENRWQNWLGALTLDEWTMLAALTLWITFALLATMQIRPALKPALRGFTRFALIITILFCAVTGADAAILFSKQVAVVVVPNATARSGPFDDAQKAFAVHDGAELSVLDQRNDWVQVTDGSGRIGWLQRQQTEVLPAN